MEEILDLLKTNAEGALKLLTASSIDKKKIEDIKKEHDQLDRTIRDTQVGLIQKDKLIGEGAQQKLVKGVRIPIPFQNKIVNTATAFEVGASVTLAASEENDLANEIKRLWRENRLDNKIQKAVKLKKSELQCALLFYIKDLSSTSLFNRFLGTNKNKEIKCRILENKNGNMSPYFDSTGDMKAFTWQFNTIVNSKEIKNVWIYTDDKVFQASTTTGTLKLDNTIDHGFGKIPIVYLNQDSVEWASVEPMIDRLEVSLSKLGASNDYSGHPILKIYGEVHGAPNKDEDGKAFTIPMEENDDGEIQHGDVKFLTYDQAPEAIDLELQKLEKFIYSLTSTPDISFDNLKSLGNISGVALKLMFLDAIVKAQMNEGDNRTFIQRIINVLISGTINTTNTGYKSKVETTYFDVVFNSIIPDDLKTAIEMYSHGVSNGIISKKTAVKSLKIVEDVDVELQEIQNNSVEEITE